MAARSKKRVGKDEGLSRPFGAEILARAQELAHKYRIILEPNDECGYIGSSLELPQVYADGVTPDGCVNAVREALTAAVAYLLESGQTPPLPPSDQVRNKQVNIRVTETEQRRLREAARANGFTDMSEYVRSRSLYA